MNGKQRFLAACLGEKTDRAPVWLMRQAGRYLPEYRAVREDHDFWQMVRTPELACEVTLQPIRRFGMDAAILFCDILVVLDAMGVDVRFAPGGPVIEPRVDNRRVLEHLRDPSDRDFEYVRGVIKMLRAELKDETALIGFAGGPFTLAAYLVQGGPSKSVFALKALGHTDFGLYHEILSRLSATVASLLRLQIEAGADAVQIFDTWSLHLGPDDYARFALPYTKAIIDAVRPLGVPVISYIRNAAGLLEIAAESGCDVLAVDSSIRLEDADRRLPRGIALQGNLDPAALSAPADVIRYRVRELCGSVKNRGHILNVGTGLEPTVPVEGVEALAKAVQELRR